MKWYFVDLGCLGGSNNLEKKAKLVEETLFKAGYEFKNPDDPWRAVKNLGNYWAGTPICIVIIPKHKKIFYYRTIFISKNNYHVQVSWRKLGKFLNELETRTEIMKLTEEEKNLILEKRKEDESKVNLKSQHFYTTLD